jgi:putative transposase
VALLGWSPDKAKEGFVMFRIGTTSSHHKHSFALIAASFLQDEGLPFADVLSAETIRQAFADQDGLFAQDEENIFSTELVLWAFLAQCLRDGKGAACSAAVADIATYLLQTGQRQPCGDTGDYCRARAKLSLPALRRLVFDSARQLEDRAPTSWLWRHRHAKLVDGCTCTMPDTSANQAEFPQNPAQEPGVGLPIARLCAVISLGTACVCDLAIGPYAGKETGECALLRTMLDAFDPGDIAVFDRCYCSYWMLALLQLRGVDVCVRQHQRRITDFRHGRRLGDRDHLITWTRPTCPPWMSPECYAQIPETLTLREMAFDVAAPDRRPETLVVVTSLTNDQTYPAHNIAQLYECRWQVELARIFHE